MLNISPINFIKNSYYTKRNYTQQSKLAPLARDTVSFKGQRELTDVRTIVRENANCDELVKNARVAENNLRRLINEEMENLVAPKDGSEGIIDSIKTRIKDSYSIEEKVISIITDGIRNDPSKVFQVKDQNSIKKHINDIVGARIILKQPDPKKNTPIIQTLIKMIRDKKLKVKEVEVITTSGGGEIRPYFTDYDIESLKNIVGTDHFKKKESETGYSALHIDIDLSDGELQAKYSGYSGEIQIIGPDIAYFKDLEDYCYKVKQGKNIRAGHPAYIPFIRHLGKYLFDKDGKINVEHKALFDEYTYKAYIIQRKKDKSNPDYIYEHLPSLEECDMTGKLPSDLDFNYLQKVKKYCDALYDLSKKENIDEKKLEGLLEYNNILNSMLVNIDPKTGSSIRKTMDKLYQLTSNNP